MNYNLSWLRYNDLGLFNLDLKGISMNFCKQCGIEFKRYGRNICCSTKCKLLYYIKIENGCWIWQGSIAGDYGKIREKDKHYSTHRMSYTLFKGEVPKDKWVCHSCDVPLCINPEHLFLGSPSDNMRDAINKNRVPHFFGEKNHFSKFTNDQTQEMRKLKNEGFTYKRLSKIFNCSVTHLVNILKNRCRKEKNGL